MSVTTESRILQDVYKRQGKTFLMLEPEVPFEIHRDRLRIEVKKDSGGSYETTTNIDFAENLRKMCIRDRYRS